MVILVIPNYQSITKLKRVKLKEGLKYNMIEGTTYATNPTIGNAIALFISSLLLGILFSYVGNNIIRYLNQNDVININHNLRTLASIKMFILFTSISIILLSNQYVIKLINQV